MAGYIFTGALTSPKETLPDQIARGTLNGYPPSFGAKRPREHRPFLVPRR
jgi:hypothetical protein